jgi:plastocyanin
MRPARVWGCLALLAGALACSGGDDDGQPSGPGTGPGGGSTTNAISVRDNSFDPHETTVAPGTTVTWTWTGANLHDVTFNNGPQSARQSSGTFARTFANAGTYAYHCTVHGSSMSGEVVVR